MGREGRPRRLLPPRKPHAPRHTPPPFARRVCASDATDTGGTRPPSLSWLSRPVRRAVARRNSFADPRPTRGRPAGSHACSRIPASGRSGQERSADSADLQITASCNLSNLRMPLSCGAASSCPWHTAPRCVSCWVIAAGTLGQGVRRRAWGVGELKQRGVPPQASSLRPHAFPRPPDGFGWVDVRPRVPAVSGAGLR